MPGNVIKKVDCEECAGTYYYELGRCGTGRASAPYYLFQSYAQRRATRSAERNLAHKLARDCDFVPCPHCGHVQQHMQQALRSRLYPTLRSLTWTLPGIVLAVTAIVTIIELLDRHNSLRETWHLHVGAAFLCVLANVGGLLLRRTLVSHVDLKDPGGAAGCFTEGAPPALLPEDVVDGAEGAPLQPVVPAASPNKPRHSSPWVTYPLMRMALPPCAASVLPPPQPSTVPHLR